jgi:hypothetical protein
MTPISAIYLLLRSEGTTRERRKALEALAAVQCDCNACLSGVVLKGAKEFAQSRVKPSLLQRPETALEPTSSIGHHYQVYGKPKASAKEVRERALKGAA